jgi:hypothetical protein
MHHDVVSGIPLLSPVCSDHHIEYVFRVLSVFPQGAGRTECSKSSVLALPHDRNLGPSLLCRPC